MYRLGDEVVINYEPEMLYGTVYAILGNGIYSIVLESGDVQEFNEDQIRSNKGE